MDRALRGRSLRLFELSPDARLKSLSKGGRARAAFDRRDAAQTRALILDEPRQRIGPDRFATNILQAIIRTISVEAGRVFSKAICWTKSVRVCDTWRFGASG